eukprot:15384259-Alexandrium_andersonii.AAC.1
MPIGSAFSEMRGRDAIQLPNVDARAPLAELSRGETRGCPREDPCYGGVAVRTVGLGRRDGADCGDRRREERTR